MNFGQIMEALFAGFGNTMVIFFVTLVLALPLGLLISFGSMSRFKPIKYIFKAFVWIIRGTPLMVLILMIFYGPALFNWSITIEDRMVAVLIAFTINYACYFSEIYRGGIESINKGQYEAGFVLGMSRYQTFMRIILPQVCKRIVPPMSNEIITLVKDTSLATIIGITELILAAKDIANEHVIIWPIFFTAVFYLVFNGILTLLFGYIEKRMSYYKV